MMKIDTRIAEKFYNWLLTFGPRLIIAVLVLFIGLWLIKLVGKWAGKFFSGKKLSPTFRPFLQNLLKLVLQLLLALVIMQLLGIKMTLVAAFIGALGVAAGLALSGTLQNFTSGILIILLKPFKIGDNIRAQGEEGTVTAIRLFYTIVVTYTNNTLIIPNGKLSNEVIFNLTLNKQRRYDIVLTFKTGDDFGKVSEHLQAAIAASKEALKEPPVRIGIKEIQPDTYDVAVNVWLNAHGFEDSKMLLNKILLTELQKLRPAPAA